MTTPETFTQPSELPPTSAMGPAGGTRTTSPVERSRPRAAGGGQSEEKRLIWVEPPDGKNLERNG
jgi:hypothetical protein